MTARNLFAFDPSGSVLVLLDGREVLVHRGDDEAPKWRHEVEGEVAGLGAGADTVITLETQGKLTWWSGATGAVLETTALGDGARALAVARDTAVCAAIVEDGVAVAVAVVARGRVPLRLPATGATAVAWSNDGAFLAIGDATGEVRILTAAGDAVGSSKLEDPVRSLCWSSAGFWIASGGDRVLRLDKSGGEVAHITRAGGMTPDCLAASADGSMVAARLTAELVMALAYPSRDTVVQLRFLDRKVAGVGFGPGRLLGVGLVGGDGNIADIPRAQLRRTDTFEGRSHNRSMVNTLIKPEVLPPEPPAPAATAAPREASPRPRASAIAMAPEAPKKGLSVAAWVVILGLLVLAVLAFSQYK